MVGTPANIFGNQTWGRLIDESMVETELAALTGEGVVAPPAEVDSSDGPPPRLQTQLRLKSKALAAIWSGTSGVKAIPILCDGAARDGVIRYTTPRHRLFAY